MHKEPCQAALLNEKYRNPWPVLAQQFTQGCRRLDRVVSREIPANIDVQKQ